MGLRYRLVWMRKHTGTNIVEKLYEKRFRTYGECLRMEEIFQQTEHDVTDGYTYYTLIR